MTFVNQLLIKLRKKYDLLITDDNRQIFRPSKCKHDKTARDCQTDVLFCTNCGLIYLGSYMGKSIWSNKMLPSSKLSQDEQRKVGSV